MATCTAIAGLSSVAVALPHRKTAWSWNGQVDVGLLPSWRCMFAPQSFLSTCNYVMTNTCTCQWIGLCLFGWEELLYRWSVFFSPLLYCITSSIVSPSSVLEASLCSECHYICNILFVCKHIVLVLEKTLDEICRMCRCYRYILKYFCVFKMIALSKISINKLWIQKMYFVVFWPQFGGSWLETGSPSPLTPGLSQAGCHVQNQDYRLPLNLLKPAALDVQ